MNFRDTLFAKLKIHPELFPTKIRAYDHLFLVCGNGYEWNEKTGELIHEIYDPKKQKHVFESRSLDKIIEDGLKERDTFRTKHKQHLKLDGWDVDRTDEEVEALLALPLEKDPNPRYTLYPASLNYSRLVTFPDSITDSWKAAVREFADFLLTIPDAEGSHAVARKALERLEALR